MDARPSHADAKPSASYRDKSGICNLCGGVFCGRKTIGGKYDAADGGHTHASGRWIVRPFVPTGMTSGNWHFAGRSRGMCA